MIDAKQAWHAPKLRYLIARDAEASFKSGAHVARRGIRANGVPIEGGS